MNKLRLKLNNRKGVTLVELIVSVALLAIFCLCCSVLIRPCAAAFDQMQKTSRAQMIGDTVIEGLRTELMNARGTIRFATEATDSADQEKPFAKPAGNDYNINTGSVLEFRTTGDNFEMIDAGFVPPTNDKDNHVMPGTKTDETTVGRLHMRYFAYDGDNKYIYKNGSAYVGYGYTTAYTDKFYMGNTITLKFTVQGYSSEVVNEMLVNRVNSVRVDLTVKDKNGDAVHNQSAILELPNAPVLVQTDTRFAPNTK